MSERNLFRSFVGGNARWQRYVPLIDVVRNYQRRDFGPDLIAGIVLGFITVPQAMAYAFLAGLPATAGLYACLLPTLIYVVFGSSRELVVGPVAVAAIMVAEALRTHAAAPESYLGITSALCLEVGVLLWCLRITRMGAIVNLLSVPVIAGFVNAAALLIIASQLASLLGTPPTAGLFEVLANLFADLPALNTATTLLGAGALLVFWMMRRFGYYLALPFQRRVSRQHPITRTGPVIVTVLATAIVAVFGLDERFGVAVVGFVPSGLPALRAPPFEPGLWIDLLPNAAMIALVAFVESYAIGATLANRKHRRIRSNQELVALGAANVAAGFSGAYPVAGSFSRSSVNVSAGARTPMSSVICTLVIVLALLILTPYFSRLPHAALAAIIILSVVDLIDFGPIFRRWRFYHYDSYSHLTTLACVLAFGVEAGLLAGIFVSVALFVRRSSMPHLAVVGRVGDSEHFRNRNNYAVTTYPGVTAVRIDENLYFANANNVENRLLRILEREGDTREVLLVASAINFIDTSGLDMLLRVNRKLERDGIRLHLSDVKVPVMQQLSACELPGALTGRIFFTAGEAVRELTQPEDARNSIQPTA